MAVSVAKMIEALDSAKDKISVQMEITDAVAILLSGDRDRMKKALAQVSNYSDVLAAAPDGLDHLRHFGKRLIATIAKAHTEGKIKIPGVERKAPAKPKGILMAPLMVEHCGSSAAMPQGMKMQALPAKVLVEPPADKVQAPKFDAPPPEVVRVLPPPAVVFDAKAKDPILVQLDPTRVEIVPVPEAEVHPTFAATFAAALRRRVGTTLTYFQRRNPDVRRDMPEPFLLSQAFADRFDKVIAEMILPRMLAVRSVRVIEGRYKWGEIDSGSFWDAVRADKHEESITAAWSLAWDSFRQRVEMKEQGKGLPPKKVLRASPDLLLLRDALGGPDGSQPYLVPRIGNREIDLFVSLLVDDFDREHLEAIWVKIRQIAEQELMTRKAYQVAAREGALRDTLLETLDRVPDATGEFIAILCHYVFGPVGLKFLEDFTRSKGVSPDSRRARVPYIMNFLEDPRVPALMEQEARNRRAEADAERLRKEEEIRLRKLS